MDRPPLTTTVSIPQIIIALESGRDNTSELLCQAKQGLPPRRPSEQRTITGLENELSHINKVLNALRQLDKVVPRG